MNIFQFLLPIRVFMDFIKNKISRSFSGVALPDEFQQRTPAEKNMVRRGVEGFAGCPMPFAQILQKQGRLADPAGTNHTRQPLLHLKSLEQKSMGTDGSGIDQAAGCLAEKVYH
jgi:hypothetical protein